MTIRLRLIGLLILLGAVPLAAQIPPGAYSSPTTGGSTSKGVSGSNPGQSVSPLDYGAKWDVQYRGDCTFINLSQTVTCPDGNFTQADVGKIVFGNCGATFVGTGIFSGTSGAIPQGTISSVTNSTTIAVSVAAIANCTPSSTVAGLFAWGTQDDTTPITNAINAAYVTPGGKCVVEFPAGGAFFSSAWANAQPSNGCWGQGTNGNVGVIADMSSVGPVVKGQGAGATTLIPLPSFNFASCTGGSLGTTCIGGTPNLHAHDFAINGMQNYVNAAHSNILFEVTGQTGGGGCDGGTTTWNLALAGWGIGATGSFGFQWGNQMCNDATLWNINVSAFGAESCKFDPQGGGNTVNTYGLFCFGANGTAPAGNVVEISSNCSFPGCTWNSYGGQYLSPLVTNNAVWHCTNTGSGGLTINSFGDQLGYGGGTPPAAVSDVICNGQSTKINFKGSNLSIPSTTTSASQAIFLNGGNTVHLDHTILNVNGGANNRIIATAATDKVFDDGGNVYTAGGTANSITAGSFFGITNSATGTACATGNFALTSGWGTSSVTSVASNGNIQGCHVTITGAAGAAGPVLTWTYPVAPIIAPGSCHLSGASGTLTGVTTGTPGATTVAFTFTGTPSAQTYSFDVGCP